MEWFAWLVWIILGAEVSGVLWTAAHTALSLLATADKLDSVVDGVWCLAWLE